VLVVEDEPLVRMYLTQVLEQLGNSVVEAGTIKEAKDVIESRSDIEIAFIDIGLPDGSGIEFAAALCERKPDLRIVVASGYGPSVDAALGAKHNVAFIAKPFDEQTIRDVIVRVR
jgi:CheY-like chemotaxis protein